MKKAISLILALVLTLPFVACNNTTIEETPHVENSSTATSSESGFVMNKNVEKINNLLSKDIDRTLKATNLFFDHPYTISRPTNDYYNDPNGRKLTDGATMDLFYGNQTYGGWDGKGAVSVDFDMGEKDVAIADIDVGCLRLMAYGIGLPEYVSVRASEDGKNYVEVSRIYTPADVPDATRQHYYFALPKALTARYVRIHFAAQDNSFLFVDEIRAFEYSESGTLDNDINGYIQEHYPINDFYEYNLNLGDSTVSVSESDADYDQERNLATIEGVEFQVQHFDALSIDNSSSKKDKLSLLTDGKLHGSNLNNDYFISQRGGGRHIVADLGTVMSVKGCNISFLDKYTWGVATPPVYYISVSENGTDWVTVFAEDNSDYGKVERGNDLCVCDFGNEFRARYVRLTFQTVPNNKISSSVYIGEWEIIGKKNPENAVTATLNKDIVYGRYPDPENFGVNNILFASITDGVGNHVTENHVMTEDAAYIYISALDKNGTPLGVLMDSIAFATRGSINSHRDRTEGYSFFLDELFYDGLNLDAVEKAKAKLNSQLGTSDKEKIFISVNCPAIGDTFNGKTIQTLEDYNECIKWMVDEAERRFKEKNYQNLELVGFYWLEEAIRPNEWDAAEAFDFDACVEFNNYVHNLGYLTLWCPYYSANGIWANHILGFDIASLQPNYMFYSAESSRVVTTAELAKLYGMSVEIEIESSDQGKDVLDYYRDYLGTGYDFGYMNSVKLYYQGAIPGAFPSSYASSDEFVRAVYDETILFATESLTSNPNRTEAIDLSGFTDKEITVVNGQKQTVEIGNIEGIKYRFSSLPAFGSVRLDLNGTLTYNSLKGYKGEQAIKIDLFDGVGETKTITVKITVE